MAQHNIFCDCQGRNKHEVLVYHTDFQANSIARSTYMRRLTIDQYFAAVRMNQAIENIHKGSFARAVFSNQGMDFSLAHGQIDMVVSNYTWPRLTDVAHLHGVWYITLFSWSYYGTFLHQLCSLHTLWGTLHIYGSYHYSAPPGSYGMPSAAGAMVRPTRPTRATNVSKYGNVLSRFGETPESCRRTLSASPNP